MLKHDTLNFLQKQVDKITRHYKTDLLRDIEILSGNHPKKILWAARESGTQIVEPTNIDWAMTQLKYYSTIQWYLLENLYEDDEEDFTWQAIDMNRTAEDILEDFFNK